MNEKLLAACGLECGICPARVAWLSGDDELRIKTAKEWSEQFHADIKPETVNCSGCLDAGGPKFSHCAACEIRACAGAKALPNCGACAAFLDCPKIKGFLQYVPEAQVRLEQFRTGL